MSAGLRRRIIGAAGAIAAERDIGLGPGVHGGLFGRLLSPIAPGLRFGAVVGAVLGTAALAIFVAAAIGVQNTMIMFRVLEIVLGHNGISARCRVAGKLEVLFHHLLSIAPDFYFRTVALEVLRPRR